MYNKVGVSELDGLEVLVYPNPVEDHFVVEVISDNNSEDFNFKLLDTRGRVLRDGNFKKRVKIDRRDLASGVYFIHLHSDSQFMQRKIIFSEKK